MKRHQFINVKRMKEIGEDSESVTEEANNVNIQKNIDEESSTEENKDLNNPLHPKSNNNINIQEEEKKSYSTIIKSLIQKVMRRHDTKISNLENDVKKLNAQNKELKAENQDFKAQINYLIRERKMDKEKIKFLLNETMKLEDEIDVLKKEVKELKNFVFCAKVRKLLKQLLEYIIKTYYSRYMNYDGNTLLFVNAPYIIGQNANYSRNVLNLMLNIIFKRAKQYDNIVHFVNENIKKRDKINLKDENDVVFSTSHQFFKHFGISEHEDILLKFIPSYYFTRIDNRRFEVKIKDLLSKLCK